MIPTWTVKDLEDWMARNSLTKAVRAAEALSVSRQFLNNVLKGRHPVGHRIVSAALLYEMQQAA